MALPALAMGVLYVVVAFVAQPLLLRWRNGSSGWLASLGATGWERIANLLFLLGCGLDLANPAFALAGVIDPLPLPAPPVTVLGVALAVFAASLVLVVRSQQVMGETWRTGIDPTHPTRLVTSGPFRLVRNPTYTSLLACTLSVALLVPTVLAALAAATCLAALQAQTRLVEEPHLRRLHGEAYQRYAAQVGRFLPGVGQLPQAPPS